MWHPLLSNTARKQLLSRCLDRPVKWDEVIVAFWICSDAVWWHWNLFFYLCLALHKYTDLPPSNTTGLQRTLRTHSCTSPTTAWTRRAAIMSGNFDEAAGLLWEAGQAPPFIQRLKCLSLCSAAMTLKWRIMGTSGVWVQCWGIWSRRGRTPHVSESYIVPLSSLHLFFLPDAHAGQTPNEAFACLNKNARVENNDNCWLVLLISDTTYCSCESLSSFIFTQVSIY